MSENTAQPENADSERAQNELASQWMKRGIALLEQNTRAGAADAVSCFDRAIELRRKLILEAHPRFRYGLAAGWMNRGDALTRLGSKDTFAEALRSYDEALRHLCFLPLEENPLFRRRFAVAWMNRGATLLEQGENFPEAVRSFGESIALLQNNRAAAITDREQLLGCAWMNHGNGLLRFAKPDFPCAYEAAMRALEFLAATERTDAVSAEAALKARHVLCRAIAGLRPESSGNKTEMKESVIEATDAVDNGMKLAREWESRGVPRFRALAEELFRFGVRAYQMYQPQFLVEFILESLDEKKSPGAKPSDEMHLEAMRGLWRSFREVQKDGFKKLDREQFEQFLQKLRELSFAENRLNELRGKYQTVEPSSLEGTGYWLSR
jgi:tetratricopeptide (TPR) repeat protein